uniref:chitinase n=1 Tax=Ciona intestinalis TaxID=7719 RepID=E9MWY0_CIOIN|nr:VCBPB15 [Ciona intestinalis]
MIVTTVTVNSYARTVASGSHTTLPCSFTMSDQSQPPIIYWIKGISVDDPDAEVIFKGFKYWNETLGENRQFFGDYEGRATVADLEQPSIQISDLTANDEGRYWCMVAEWSGRQQEGTDADSMALMIDGSKSYAISYQTGASVTVNVGYSTMIECSYNGGVNVVTWYEGPFHLPDSENFTHTEIGTYTKVGTRYLSTPTVVMETGFNNMGIDHYDSLYISGATKDNSGRYWCEVSRSSAANQELQTDRSSTLLSVNSPPFECEGNAPGLYPDPDDCSMYYECVSGNPITYHRSCGYDGLVFDETNDYCDWAANVAPPCGTASN